MRAQVETHLPLDDGIHEQPQHREHRQGRNALGFLQPYRANSRWILEPPKAGFYGSVLLVLRLQNLRICTPLQPSRRCENRPPVGGLHIREGCARHHEAIAGLHRGRIGLGGPSPARPTPAPGVSHHVIGHGVRAPGPRTPSSLSVPTAFIVRYGRCRIHYTSEAVGCHTPDMLSKSLSFLGLGARIGLGVLLG
jgi:hypothetical protein